MNSWNQQMSVIKVSRQHSLDVDTVRERVEAIAQKLHKDLGADYHWEGDALRFSRPGASGHIAVTDSDLQIEVKLGMLLSALKGAVERTLNEELDKRLS